MHAIIRDRLARPVAVGLVALVAASAFVLVKLASEDWEPTSFVRAGENRVDRSQAPADLIINEGGYDGVFFYRMALAPLDDAESSNGITFDSGAYRSQRVLYPAIAWALSLGLDSAVPWVLIFINLAAMFLAGYLGALLARDRGRPAMYGLLIALYPGLLTALAFDTAEAVAAAFMVGALVLLNRSRFVAAGWVLAGGVLTRETVLILPIALGAVWLWRRRSGLRRWAAVALPATAYLAWQVVVAAAWGEPSLVAASNRLALPLVGIVEGLSESVEQGALDLLFFIGNLGLLLLLAAAVLAGFRRSGSPEWERVGWLIATALLLLVREPWAGPASFLRAGTEQVVLGFAVVLGVEGNDRLMQGLVAITVVAWFGSALARSVLSTG